MLSIKVSSFCLHVILGLFSFLPVFTAIWEQVNFSNTVSSSTPQIGLSWSMLDLTHTVVYFVSTSAKFGISTSAGLTGTRIEAKMRTFKCPILTHAGANAKFGTGVDEMDYSAKQSLY
jgi:hypothetical protein